jgi:hypothetical protein
MKGEAALEKALLLRPRELSEEQRAKGAKNIHDRTSDMREPSNEDWTNVLSIARNKSFKLRIIQAKYYQLSGENPESITDRFAVAPGWRCGIFGRL